MVVPVIDSFTVIHEDWGENIEDFLIDVQVDIGPDNSAGSETFTFRVISPKRLEKYLEGSSIEIGRGMLITKDYNIQTVKSHITRILRKCKGSSWREVALLLSRYSYWEFEE